MRQRLLASSIICGAALAGLAALPASAQETGNEVTEIVVTGSRIPQPNLESVSPVQVVGSEEVTLGGRAVTADLLNQLPQVFQNSQIGFSTTSNPLSGPGGIATIDLRGLGQQRTLVLVDGRRLGIGDPNTGNTNPSPDINQIPSQLIERVEVLTGGASATYGSDAVAGVVNFVMKRNFEGVEIDAQWGVYQHNQHNEYVQSLLPARQIRAPKENVWDGRSQDLSVVFGSNLAEDKGNVTGYVTYHHQDPVVQSQRDYSACQLVLAPGGIVRCEGSPNSNQWLTASGDNFIVNGVPTARIAVVGNQFAPYSITATTTPPPFFNSHDYAHLIQDGTRYTAGFMANYEVSEHFNLYADFNMMNDKSNVQIAPTGLFQASGSSPTGGFLVNCNNPLMSAQQQATCNSVAVDGVADLYIGRRNIEGGGRNSFYEHTNYRFVGGTRGTLFGPFSYDVYASYYYTSLYQASQNYLSIAGIQNALLVEQGPNGPRCIDATARSNGCVPYNIFQDGQVSEAALDYLDLTGTSRGTITERIIEATVTGDLGDYGIKSPWAENAIGVAFGVQSRRDHLEYAPDAAQLSGDLSGAGGASTQIDNSISVMDFYGEVRVPLVQDMPWVRDLLFEAGYRYSDYSTGIATDTYKLGLQWAPTEDIRFRTSFQQAVRAPSILELYAPQSVTNTSQIAEDPCAANAQNPATLAQCLNTGITAAQYGNIPNCPSGQCAVLLGGNPELGAEEAKTFSIGFSTTPRFIRGFTASVDYFHIDLEGTIGAIGLGIIMDKCLETGDPTFCSQIVRASNGVIFGTSIATGGYLNGTNINVGAGTAEGVDVQMGYNLPLDTFGMDQWGSLSFQLAGSYLLKASTVSLPGEPEYDCVGLFGTQCATLNPRWRHTLRINWRAPHDVVVSAAWRYFGEVKLETDTNEPTIGNGGVNIFNHLLPARSYLDLSARWNINDMFSVRAGVNNVLDQDPPLVNNRISQTGLPQA
jgi:iron complex outermembrane recepter protein